MSEQTQERCANCRNRATVRLYREMKRDGVIKGELTPFERQALMIGALEADLAALRQQLAMKDAVLQRIADHCEFGHPDWAKDHREIAKMAADALTSSPRDTGSEEGKG